VPLVIHDGWNFQELRRTAGHSLVVLLLCALAAGGGAAGCDKGSPAPSDGGTGGGLTGADTPGAVAAPLPGLPRPAPDKEPEAAPEEPEDFVIYLRPKESLADVVRRANLDEATLRAASGLARDAPTPAGTRLVLRLTPSDAADFLERRTTALGPLPSPAAASGDARGGVAGSGSGERELVTVQVRRDELLGLYASWASVPLKDLLAANPDLNPDRIARGQRVVVPVPKGRRIEFEQARESWHERRQAARAPKGPDGGSSLAASEDAGCTRTWRLRQGDIVWKLARRWDVKVNDIQRCNPGVKLDRVTAGRVLRVPDAAQLPE
jgi:LysM repeat protein